MLRLILKLDLTCWGNIFLAINAIMISKASFNGRTANVFVPAQQQRGGGVDLPPLEKNVLYLQKSDFLRNKIGTISCEIIRAIF